ncbi:hypothetical protein FISHEDRAFT_73310 [Fistulina hepatica ATCC 64428]|uniref:Uncharacterized protein n=1 Tax=Fistulina hepatica ATCC 64428 TaxID=1128425 RepID=A0A0D7AEI4_9AGAR|nr:hypothetical protein FISHEDRAFT_73310 [Fistulina hepatica ATCC 64428]
MNTLQCSDTSPLVDTGLCMGDMGVRPHDDADGRTTTRAASGRCARPQDQRRCARLHTVRIATRRCAQLRDCTHGLTTARTASRPCMWPHDDVYDRVHGPRMTRRATQRHPWLYDRAHGPTTTLFFEVSNIW